MKLGQKSVKNLVGFLGDLKTPKFHSEINWPLALIRQNQPTNTLVNLGSEIKQIQISLQ